MFLQCALCFFVGVKTQKDLLRLFDQSTAIDEGVNVVREGVNEGVNFEDEGVNTLLDLIRTEPGLNARTLAAKTGKSLSTTERHIRKLKNEGVIEFRGAPKNGGYYSLTPKK
ncbi:hypothetical protein McpSp1_16780 [Methanocorpusculaceae archaeon Sp1]|nr:hypothetical protein [Methanocorpusculaceae archaeon Sp1]